MIKTVMNVRIFVGLVTLGILGGSFAISDTSEAGDLPPLNFHLMHPGGPSAPGDPNAAFHLDGTYYIHYILRHPWKGRKSFSFVHVSSPDMLHWTWHTTQLQPSFTGHGMFSGTGFITQEGRCDRDPGIHVRRAGHRW